MKWMVMVIGALLCLMPMAFAQQPGQEELAQQPELIGGVISGLGGGAGGIGGGLAAAIGSIIGGCCAGIGNILPLALVDLIQSFSYWLGDIFLMIWNAVLTCLACGFPVAAVTDIIQSCSFWTGDIFFGIWNACLTGVAIVDILYGDIFQCISYWFGDIFLVLVDVLQAISYWIGDFFLGFWNLCLTGVAFVDILYGDIIQCISYWLGDIFLFFEALLAPIWAVCASCGVSLIMDLVQSASYWIGDILLFFEGICVGVLGAGALALDFVIGFITSWLLAGFSCVTSLVAGLWGACADIDFTALCLESVLACCVPTLCSTCLVWYKCAEGIPFLGFILGAIEGIVQVLLLWINALWQACQRIVPLV